MPTRAPRLGSFGQTARNAAPPTTTSFTSALPASTRPEGPNSRRRPAPGFSFESVGLNGVRLILRRTWATLTSSPAIAAAITTGATATPKARSPHSVNEPIPAFVASCVFPDCARPCVISASSWETMRGPPIISAPNAATSPETELRSGDFATWPLARASPRRFGVAFSVRSSRGAMAQCTRSEESAW